MRAPHRPAGTEAVHRLSGACVQQLCRPVYTSTSFKNIQRTFSVDAQVVDRSLHGLQVADLPRKVEDVVLSQDQILHGMGVPDIRDVDVDLVLNSVDVEEVSAVGRDHGIYD